MEIGLFFEGDRYELYQIEQDPEEKIDLAKREVAKLNELKQLLSDWEQQIGAQSPTKNNT